MSKKAFRVLVDDVTEGARDLYQKNRETSSKWLSDTGRKVRKFPRRTFDFAKGFGKGYVFEQTLTSAAPYTSRVIQALYKPRQIPNGAGEFFGGLTGIVQDTMTSYWASSFFEGNNNALTLAATIVGGAKLVLNTVALGALWYQSARERAGKPEPFGEGSE